MQKWEYLIVNATASDHDEQREMLMEKLIVLGKCGWKVHTIDLQYSYALIERELREEVENSPTVQVEYLTKRFLEMDQSRVSSDQEIHQAVDMAIKRAREELVK